MYLHCDSFPSIQFFENIVSIGYPSDHDMRGIGPSSLNARLTLAVNTIFSAEAPSKRDSLARRSTCLEYAVVAPQSLSKMVAIYFPSGDLTSSRTLSLQDDSKHPAVIRNEDAATNNLVFINNPSGFILHNP